MRKDLKLIPATISRLVLLGMLSSLLASCHVDPKSNLESVQTPKKPNIVIFYVDDLGWGDVSSYGATSVSTPNIDKLASNGIRFTDAHSSTATCTPSRYSLLTGEYAFRKNIKIIKGDAAMVVSPEQYTLPKMLQKQGYKTAVIGKWHLGLGDGKSEINWNTPVTPGPHEIGFGYSFLLPSTGDRVPSVYLENYDVVGLDKTDPLTTNYDEKIGNRPTGYENPELLRQGADNQHDKTIINGVSRIGWMAGGKSAEWIDEDFPDVLTEKANSFISNNANDPFLLFFSFHDVHVPRLPNDRFKGATTMGVRGDAIVQMDWMTGKIVDHLKAQDLLDNTMIIFTSDNGAVLTDGYDDQAIELVGDHKANGPFRGGKYSAFEGGTRVPMIVHYPGLIEPGVSHSLFGQIDFYASIAGLLNVELSNNEAIDSQNNIKGLLNYEAKARQTLIAETPHTLVLRNDDWKYIRPTERSAKFVWEKKKIESGIMKTPQLYNLGQDLGETKNIAKEYPKIVNEMEAQMNTIEQQSQRINKEISL